MSTFLKRALTLTDALADKVNRIMEQITEVTKKTSILSSPMPVYTDQNEYSQRPFPTWTGEEICQRIWLQLCLSTTEEQQHKHFQTLSYMQNLIEHKDSVDEAWTEFLNDTPGLRGYIQDFALKYNEEEIDSL